jgi:exoribonuclease R
MFPVECHGGKLVIVVNDKPILVPHQVQCLPGDVMNQEMNIIKRNAQSHIGLVHRATPTEAHITLLTVSGVFSPIVYGSYEKGERVVVWFKEDGSYHVVQRYSFDAIDDASCIRQAYSLLATRTRPETTQGASWYTKPYTDHSDLMTCTIDPAHSVDFDDAISMDEHAMYVHIVDMAHAELTEREQKRLRERCLTLYLANESTDHLLDDETASNHLSLVVGQPRRTITVRMVVEQGKVTSFDIYPSTIVVKRRYTYEQVITVLTAANTAESVTTFEKGRDEYVRMFDTWRNVSRLRSTQIDYHLYLPAVRFRVLPTGEIDSVLIEPEDESHQLVATAMIMTNMVVSCHLRACGVIFPNRFHETLRGIRPSPSMVKTGHPHVDSFLMVKTYARAHYAIDEAGHFGLGLSEYIHFTSPMRRYADVLVHRILAGTVYTKDVLEDEVQWINRQATNVKTLQTLYSKWKLSRYATRERHTVYITGVNRGGVMWFLPDLSLSGYSHVTKIMPSQRWTFCSTHWEGSSMIRVGSSFTATIKVVDGEVVATIHTE